VSIIIPTAAKRASIWGFDMVMVVNLLHSIASVTTYPNVELILVADDPLCDAVSSQITAVAPETKIIGYDQDFNFSEKCNLGAAQSQGEVLIFLNDDMEVISADWIETMVGFLQEPDVGAVGPLLLDEQRRVQSAGHTVGPRLFGRGAARSCADLEVDLMLTREVCGITGAAIAMRAAVYAEIGGFATELPRNFNDVDLCYRLLASGKRVLWTPNAVLFHFESKSRDPTAQAYELAEIDRRWAEELRYDPYLRMDLTEFNHRSAIWLHGAD
jgi:GT2 family glycosyltransferase